MKTTLSIVTSAILVLLIQGWGFAEWSFNQVIEGEPQAADETSENSLSPEMILKNKFEGKATVEFQVDEVHTLDINSLFVPDDSHDQIIKAKISGATTGQEFLVIVKKEVATRLLNLGIADPVGHFRGKILRVAGTVERIKRPSPSSVIVYRIQISDLDQLEIIRKPLPEVPAPGFDQLVIKIEPFGLGHPEQTEELRIEATGRCWYRVDGRDAQQNVPARPAAVFHHDLAPEHIRRLNRLLDETGWLTAEGAEGRASHTHPTTVTLILRREGQERSVVCQGRRPQPYGSLLHAIHGLATQERRVYLWKYVGGEPGAHAWAEVGREIAALRGDPYGDPPFEIDYSRYLPIARDVIYPFYTRQDVELIPAVRLAGYFKVASELDFLHRMAHDRSSNLRREVAWALGRIHREESLPVLASMMSAPANREAAGLQLVTWGEQAVPYIVELISMSTDPDLVHWKNTTGEDMIRAYLDHWSELDQPIDARVTAAVREALESRDPENGLIRTEYHKAFLRQLE